jgi:hypothetical protein
MHQEPSGVWIMAYTTIDDPSKHFQTVIYTGGGDDSSVTFGGNSDLQLDFLWVKRRDSSGNSKVFDTSRGIGSGSEPYLTTVSNEAEQTYGYLTSVNSDGFTWDTTDATTGASGNTYVAWGWKANGGTTSSNTSGTMTSTVQANTTAGFSILTYAGQDSAGTVGHGLGAEPHLIIIKNRTGDYSWHCYWKVLGNQGLNWLESTAAASSSSGTWNTTTPTSTLFSMDGGSSWSGTNRASNNFVAYCFAPIQGYSKFGKYVGNGNADGTFIYTGFKPAWVMWKRTDGGTNMWQIMDTTRNTYNVMDKYLQANSTAVEADYDFVDFLSNGFKHRHTSSHSNGDDETYVYLTFAENPFVTSGGVPCTAR